MGSDGMWNGKLIVSPNVLSNVNDFRFLNMFISRCSGTLLLFQLICRHVDNQYAHTLVMERWVQHFMVPMKKFGRMTQIQQE
jgi:hypothetical protein